MELGNAPMTIISYNFIPSYMLERSSHNDHSFFSEYPIAQGAAYSMQYYQTSIYL